MRHNQRPVTPVLSATPAGDPMTRLMWRGYEDVRLKRPYTAEFEKWTPDDQMNYEAGRRSAAAIVRHFPGHVLPPWPEGVDLPSILPPTVPQGNGRRFHHRAAIDHARKGPCHMTAKRWRGEELERLRVAYEDSPLKLWAIAADFGTSQGCFSRLARLHGWKRRQGVGVIRRYRLKTQNCVDERALGE